MSNVNTVAREVDKVASVIKPATYPRWRQDLLDMIAKMDPIYKNEPVETHAKRFSEILVEYGCA